MSKEYYSLTEEQPRIDDIKRQKKLTLTDQGFLRCVCKTTTLKRRLFFSQVYLLLLIFNGTDILFGAVFLASFRFSRGKLVTF